MLNLISILFFYLCYLMLTNSDSDWITLGFVLSMTVYDIKMHYNFYNYIFYYCERLKSLNENFY